MEFRILGPLEVVRDGRPIRLDRQRLRALLAYLLLHANEAVSADQLIDQIWGPEPPKTASASLQNYVSRLRKALGPDLLLSRPPGYLLRVDPERFDLTRFERLAAEARGAAPRERAEKLRAALSLWRGRVLEDLAFEAFVQEEARRLEEARLSAFEERLEAELELGEDATLVTELEELVEDHPLRERLHGQLMLALYRAGRQADALEAYQRARRVLDEELGLEPSEELRALQQAILQQDASLGARGSGQQERPADRRVVTVLFCDLVGSTDLATRLDPEAYRILMERYFVAVRAPIERHGGTVEKFIGDAVMAAFGVPELHEDDALRAVRAAVNIRAALVELAELARAEWDVPFAGRIGVNTGEVHVVSAPGEDLHLTGAAVSIASKLEESARPGEILLAEETLGLVRDAVRAEPFPLEGSTRAWRLEDLIAGAPAYARRLDVPLVGREEELERLSAAFENARREKHCSVVTVVGEAGIGKTRLIRELVTGVGDNGRVLVGRCVSYGEGATYLPIGEIIRAAVPDTSVAGIAAVLAGNDDAEQVARRVAELIDLEEGPAAPGEAFWAMRRLFEAVARDQPTVLVLDDIHWAEPTLLDLVEYLGAWAEAPILLICAARRELLERRPDWGGPTSTGFLVELPPLPPEEVASLLVGLAAEPLDPELEERIVRHAGGNPLFAEQLLALAAEAPDLALDDPPPTVEALLASRLDRLDPLELAVLRRAAVVGRRFSREELDDLTPSEEAARTNHALIDLDRRGLVHPADEIYRFHHVLVRDVAYRAIPKAERAELHELAARGLDRRDQPDEVVGYHFEQAYRCVIELGRPDEHARELAAAGGERLGRAGVRAWKRADAPAAVNLLARACSLLPPGDQQRRELLCELGTALRMRGELQQAEVVLSEAVNTAVEARDRRIELRGALELANVRTWVEPDEAPALLDLAAAAIPELESAADDRALGRAWLMVATVRGGLYGENAAWEEAALRAAHHYARAGWSPSTCLDAVASALFYGPKPVDEAVQICERLLTEHPDDRASEACVRVWMAGLLAMRGQFDEARAANSRARMLSSELGQTMAAEVTCGIIDGEIETLAGRPEIASEALQKACELCEQRGERGLLGSRSAELVEALVAQGRLDEAEPWARIAESNAAEEDRSAKAAALSATARLRAHQGDHEPAESRARSAVELIAGTDSLNQRAQTLLNLGEVLRIAGKADAAAAAASDAAGLYEQKGNVVAAARAQTLGKGLAKSATR